VAQLLVVRLQPNPRFGVTNHTMKKNIHGLLLAFTLALVVTGCATSNHSTAWDYSVQTVAGNVYTKNNEPVAQETINRMTQQGWHLVSASAAGEEPKIVLVFKRHK